MSQDAPPEDLMHYDVMAQDALRGVVRAALKRAAAPEGLPGEHHFYITFKTQAPGVSGPAEVLAKYPDEMTIVLQHQYDDLAPGETFFSVSLRFGGVPRTLSIPYAAVTRFMDPSVQFLLQFDPPETPREPTQPTDTDDESASDAPSPPGGDEPKVVSLDQFRKK
jgi:hypothetical protein